MGLILVLSHGQEMIPPHIECVLESLSLCEFYTFFLLDKLPSDLDDRCSSGFDERTSETFF